MTPLLLFQRSTLPSVPFLIDLARPFFICGFTQGHLFLLRATPWVLFAAEGNIVAAFAVALDPYPHHAASLGKNDHM